MAILRKSANGKLTRNIGGCLVASCPDTELIDDCFAPCPDIGFGEFGAAPEFFTFNGTEFRISGDNRALRNPGEGTIIYYSRFLRIQVEPLPQIRDSTTERIEVDQKLNRVLYQKFSDTLSEEAVRAILTIVWECSEGSPSILEPIIYQAQTDHPGPGGCFDFIQYPLNTAPPAPIAGEYFDNTGVISAELREDGIFGTRWSDLIVDGVALGFVQTTPISTGFITECVLYPPL